MHTAPAIQEYLNSAPRHRRIIGPPASGKTTLLVERWRALTAKGHHPGIVAFGHEHRDHLLERLIAPGHAHLGAHPVTTHALVASGILDAASPRRARTLREVDELLLLGRLLRREPSLLASDLATISSSATFTRDMLQAVHALAQHGLAPDTARECARDCANLRARDVLGVFARHHETCAEHGLVSFYDAAWRAAELFDTGGVDSPLAPFDVILIDDFHDLDPGQYHLLTRLISPRGSAALEVFGDPTGARFGFRGTSDRFQERFQRDYAATDVGLRAPHSGDVALNQTIASLIALTSGASPDSAAPTADLPLFANADARSTHAARPAWECTATLVIADDEIAEAQAVAQRVRAAIDAGVAPRDIAVIARDADGYRAVLQMACHEWGVPLDAGGRENGATEELLRSLLGSLGSDLDGHHAEALKVSPFGAGYDDAGIRALKREYGSRTGFDLERLLADRVTPMLSPGDSASRGALVSITDEWYRYNEVVAHAGGGASLDEFRATYLAEPAASARHADRIQLLSAREASGRAFKTAFVVGCAEGFFPGATARDGYIPLAALAGAVETVNPDASEDIAARLDEAAVERAENALFLTALTRAVRSLTILAPARIRGEAPLPSGVLAIGTRPFATEHAARIESPCARAAGAVAAAVPQDPLANTLRPLDELAGWWVTPPARERFPTIPSFSMSASKLNAYARCPRQFFYRNVLRLDEPESIYLTVGTLVHDALKEIIPPGATGDDVRAALRAAGTRDIAERLVAASMKDQGVWMRELSVNYLESMLKSVAELEAQREGKYRVRLLEEDAQVNVEGMPLRGRVDRVDDVEGLGPLVIDYKTSGSIKRTYPSLIEKMDTEYWQIPVYAAMTALMEITAAGFVYYALPPGEDSFAAGVQLAHGDRPAPIPLGPRRPYRYGPVPAEDVAGAIARAIAIYRSIVEGECRYERTANTSICPNCHFARICQRSRASL